MGMFDSVKLDGIKFPFEGKFEVGEYQTKDFDCSLDTIVFHADGTITRERGIYAPTPEEDRPYYGKPEWDGPWGKAIGMMHRTETVVDLIGLPERETYHFYASIEDATESWLDIWADVENHKVIQFRWEISDLKNGEHLLDKGKVILNV
jgi:hypothetical protein